MNARRQARYLELTEYYNASNILLKQLIHKDYPQLQDPNLDDWTKVNLLRQWAYENVDWGVQSTHFNTDPEIKYFSLSTPMLFATFCRDVGGTYCGGTSFALMRLYRLYGYNTYTFGMGNPEVMTHTVTLVKIKHKGNEKLTVQDAAFNLTYVDDEGEPYDFFQMLEALKNHNHHLVHIEEKPGCIRDVIFSNKSELGPFRNVLIPDKENGQVEAQLPGGKFKAKVCISLASFNEIYGPRIGRFLIDDGHPPESIYLYLYPVSINDGTGESPLIQQAKAIANAPDRKPVIARKPENSRN